MSWSLTIGRFGATTVRVHFTFFLLLAWIAVRALSRPHWACRSVTSAVTNR
jgi:hypothetical protein